MKILKMTTHWSAEEADCVFRLLDELQTVIWENYGDEIERLYQTDREEQMQLEMEWEQKRKTVPLDEILF